MRQRSKLPPLFNENNANKYNYIMKKKIYKIKIDPTDQVTGLDAISLVEYPAVEVDFLKFSKDENIKLQFENEEKRIITGVALLADTPIYRIKPDGEEYYVVFDKDTIEQLITKYAKYMFQNFVNIEHENNHFVDGLYMIESYIKNSERGIAPAEFASIPDGSWIVSYKVDNMDVWEKIKSGEVKGFSVQGVFQLIEQAEEPSIDQLIEDGDIEGLLKSIK